MQKLTHSLKIHGYLKDSRVESVILRVDRANYCPSTDPYQDCPFSIGYGATISAPHMHAYALEILKDKLVDGVKVLDVGSGSGYLTACLAHMVGPRGRVYGVEHIRELVKQSESNMRRDCSDLLDSGRVKLLYADGRVGLPEEAPFDVIHVGACASGLPEELLKQLKNGGRMVLPIDRENKQIFERVDKLANGDIKREDLLHVRYVPLTDAKSQLNS